ncbi:WD-40 repeat-containing protein [Umezawaea tangerina]|uniref:WD-40 repeat-containing protein n=1 Tax=Umezawaea tangerina TaxID=84725 RepID=A0A2T0T433_9PSEU|nr:WD-40 repeat-containing protein [Umezawaea tangerina]
MPRRERPLDVGDSPLLGFAADLRAVREKAGSPPYRELGVVAHYSAATLSDAAGGRKLPRLAVTLAYVRACGGDPVEWEARWHALAAELSAAGEPADGDAGSPYVGLAAFQPEDSARFFGRERLVEEVRARLADHRFVGVLGVSGAGKSSLLRAGLLPGLRAALFTPGARPMRELARVLAEHPPGDELVVVVDQFEEVFTLCRDESERARFIDALLAEAESDVGARRVVVGIRADFYHRCAAHTGLARALAEAQVAVGPMSSDELPQAIIKPAVQAGCTVEGPLLAKIIADATGQAGMLPLVSHALLETWRRRRGNALTVAGYEASGGIHGAIAQTAEQVYTALDPGRQRRARQILLRLITLGEGNEDTRRRVPCGELDDDPDTAAVLDALARARLVALDRDSVEIAHEALIRSWPRLRDWLAEDRADIRVHRGLTEATAAWEAVRRDPGALYRGVRLAVTGDWAKRHADDMTAHERSFLDSSTHAEEADQALRQRRNRQLRWLTTALSVLLVVAVAVTFVAVRQRQDAVSEGLVSTSRQLAAEAETLAGKDVARAMRASLDAYQSYPTVEARSEVLSLASRRDYQALLPSPSDVRTKPAFTPDGRLLAAPGAPGRVDLWDVVDHTRRTELSGSFGQVLVVAVSVDGALLAAGTEDGEVLIWRLADRSLVARAAASPEPVRELRFSPDGRVVAVADAGATRLLGTGDARLVATPGSGTGSGSLAFSPDGTTLAFTDGGGVVLWDLRTATAVGTLPSPEGLLSSVAFSPDGRTVATAGAGRSVRLWDTGTRQRVADLDHVDSVAQVEFDPTGGRLFSVDIGGTVVVWDLARRARVGQLLRNKNHGVGAAVFSPDGRFIAGSSKSGFLLWDRTRVPFIGHVDTVSGVAFDPVGGNVVSSSADGSLLVWDRETRAPLASVPGGGTSSLETRGPWVSPDGRWVVAGYGGKVVLRDAATLAEVRTVIEGHVVEKAVFSPDSRTLAVIVDARTVRFVDLATGSHRDRTVDGDGALDVNYSPDGRSLAVATVRGRVLVWDTETDDEVVVAENGHASTVVFSPDGTVLAATTYHDGAGRVVLWDAASHRRTGELTDPGGRFSFLAYSPDGRLIATFDHDDTVTLLDAATLTRWAVLSGHTGPVTDLAWSPDGTLASASRDLTVTPWTTDVQAALGELCRALASDFHDGGAPPAACAGLSS